jgi:hypothetical protein
MKYLHSGSPGVLTLGTIITLIILCSFFVGREEEGIAGQDLERVLLYGRNTTT